VRLDHDEHGHAAKHVEIIADVHEDRSAEDGR
jgi:hypothetical protein